MRIRPYHYEFWLAKKKDDSYYYRRKGLFKSVRRIGLFLNIRKVQSVIICSWTANDTQSISLLKCLKSQLPFYEPVVWETLCLAFNVHVYITDRKIDVSLDECVLAFLVS